MGFGELMAVIRERIIRNGVSHRNSNGPPATENGGVGVGEI